MRILGHTQSAEEVLTELYEEVRQRAAQFGKQNERPLTWLILMAHRRAIERLCRQLTTNSETLRKSADKAKSISSINITEQRRLVRAWPWRGSHRDNNRRRSPIRWTTSRSAVIGLSRTQASANSRANLFSRENFTLCPTRISFNAGRVRVSY